MRRAGRRHRPPSAAPLRCSVLRATAELAAFAFGSLRSDNRSESVHEARCARARKPCAARRCLHGRPGAHTTHREMGVASGGAGRPRPVPNHDAGCKVVGRAVGAPLRCRASQKSRVAPRSGEAKERFWPWRVQRPCPKSTRSDPSISRSAGDPEAQRRGAAVKRPQPCPQPCARYRLGRTRNARPKIFSAVGAAIEGTAAHLALELVR